MWALYRTVAVIMASRPRVKRIKRSSTTRSPTSSDSEIESEPSHSSTSNNGKQRKVYRQAYRSDWEQHSDLQGWLSRSRSRSGLAFCKICNCNLEAKLSDLKRHSTTKKHDNARLIGQHRTLFSFTNMTLDSKVHGIKSWNCNLLTIFIQVSFAEALWANFTAEHNLSFALSDHATRLFSKMFPDSDIAKKFSSARTKTTAIVTNVLAPFLREKVVMSMKCRPFSLLFDDIGVVKSACMVIRIFDDDS